MPQISAPPLCLLHWPHKKSSHSVCFHTWLSSPAGCQTAEQNIPKNMYFSPSIFWSTLALNSANGCAFFWVTGFTDYKSWKRRYINCGPDLYSSSSTALFHPGTVIARASESMKGTWDEKKGEEVAFIDPFVSYSPWHLPWLARLCENLLHTPYSRGGPVQRWRLWKQAPYPKPTSKALMFFQPGNYLDLGFFTQ